MNYRRLGIALTAFAIGASLAACRSAGLPGQSGEDAGTGAPRIGIEEPDTKTIIGKVTSFNGTKITVDIGEITQPSPDETGNGNDKGNESGASGRKGLRTAFKSSGESATYDISGLKKITIENGKNNETDTLDKIKTGSIVAIVIGADGNPSSLTIKSGNARQKGNGERNGDRGSRPSGSRPNGSRPSGNRNGNGGQNNRNRNRNKGDQA